jgi:hypothetical protein
MSQKCYIAGKITGDQEYYEKFQRALFKLRAQGYTVVTPTILPDGLTHDDYMHICFSLVDVCDVCFFLPDWEDSPGAQEEHRYALHTGKIIIYEKESK